MSKGVAARRKSFSDSVTHCCVYVVFSEAKAATEAAKHFNGLKLGNRHLNANLACDKHTCNARSVDSQSFKKEGNLNLS